MNKKEKNILGTELSKTIFVRFFITLVIYTVALIVVFLTVRYIFTRFTWYKGDFLYELLRPISNHIVAFVLGCWTVGFIIIFIYHWKRTLEYIDIIAKASSKLVDTNEEYIHLPVELKQVEERLNYIKQQAIRNARIAKEAEQRKNDLIVYLAHDLKTPLTSVIGYLTLLCEERDISEELRNKYLAISLDRAERLGDLIDEFFEITRFNLSTLSLELSCVNLSRMLEQILYEFRPQFAEKNLQYELQIPPDTEIICDIDKMERVFDNLIRNAINYSYLNTMIKIIVLQNQNAITMHFINHGKTIPKEKLKIIFEQFYRLDKSRDSKTGGSGLGLAIAKEIIELHHGSIEVISENEKIEFIVSLPMPL